MNLLNLCKFMEEELGDNFDSFELLGDAYDEAGGSWFFALDEENVAGFVSCENNKENLNVPTVSIAISLNYTCDYSMEELLKLFDLNGEFINAALSIQKIDEATKRLFINRRLLAKNLDIKSIRTHVDDLIGQANIFLG